MATAYKTFGDIGDFGFARRRSRPERIMPKKQQVAKIKQYLSNRGADTQVLNLVDDWVDPTVKYETNKAEIIRRVGFGTTRKQPSTKDLREMRCDSLHDECRSNGLDTCQIACDECKNPAACEKADKIEKEIKKHGRELTHLERMQIESAKEAKEKPMKAKFSVGHPVTCREDYELECGFTGVHKITKVKQYPDYVLYGIAGKAQGFVDEECLKKVEVKPPKLKDIEFKRHFILSTTNPDLYRFIQDSKKELTNTVSHRRGIIKGYILVNLDSLKKEGRITETERKAGAKAIERIYDLITDVKQKKAKKKTQTDKERFEREDIDLPMLKPKFKVGQRVRSSIGTPMEGGFSGFGKITSVEPGPDMVLYGMEHIASGRPIGLSTEESYIKAAPKKKTKKVKKTKKEPKKKSLYVMFKGVKKYRMRCPICGRAAPDNFCIVHLDVKALDLETSKKAQKLTSEIMKSQGEWKEAHPKEAKAGKKAEIELLKQLDPYMTKKQKVAEAGKPMAIKEFIKPPKPPKPTPAKPLKKKKEVKSEKSSLPKKAKTALHSKILTDAQIKHARKYGYVNVTIEGVKKKVTKKNYAPRKRIIYWYKSGGKVRLKVVRR